MHNPFEWHHLNIQTSAEKIILTPKTHCDCLRLKGCLTLLNLKDWSIRHKSRFCESICQSIRDVHMWKQTDLLSALKNYSHVSVEKSRIDRMHMNFKCCGSRGYTDWWEIQWCTTWIDPYELSVSIYCLIHSIRILPSRLHFVFSHFLNFTARCYAERAIRRYCYDKSSVCLWPVHYVEASWSHRLEIFKNNVTVS